MSELTLSKPIQEEDSDQWIVYVIGANNLLTGVAGRGSTSQEATRNALVKIEKGEGKLEKV